VSLLSCPRAQQLYRIETYIRRTCHGSCSAQGHQKIGYSILTCLNALRPSAICQELMVSLSHVLRKRLPLCELQSYSRSNAVAEQVHCPCHNRYRRLHNVYSLQMASTKTK
jgi:hypothetical protein